MADSTDRTGSDAAPLVHAVNVTKAFHGNEVLKGIDMVCHQAAEIVIIYSLLLVLQSPPCTCDRR